MSKKTPKPLNVIFLAEYIEENFWALVEKGHFKEMVAAFEKEAAEIAKFEDEDSFSLPVPANDGPHNEPFITISLEDVEETETSVEDLFNNFYAWEEQELDPDDYKD